MLLVLLLVLPLTVPVVVQVPVPVPHDQTQTYLPPTHKQTHEADNTTTTKTASTVAARAAGMQTLVDKMACHA